MKYLKVFSVLAIVFFTMKTGSGNCGAAAPQDTAAAGTGGTVVGNPVTINFNLKSGHGTLGAPAGISVGCATPISSIGSIPTAGASVTGKVSLTDARFYVSNIALIDDNGVPVPVILDQDGAYQYANVALLDFENKTGDCVTGDSTMHTAVTGIVETGHTFTTGGLQFSVGVPDYGKLPNGSIVELNHTDSSTMPSPLNNSSMAWSWQSGRKFVKIEINPENPVTPNTFTGGINPAGIPANTWFMHLGATGCVASNSTPGNGSYLSICTNPNILPLKFTGFKASANSVTLDIKALFAASDVTTATAMPIGCMSGTTDTDCTNIFVKLGLDLLTGKPLGTTNLGMGVLVPTADISPIFFVE